MTELTEKERRVYLAALMGLVKRYAGAMFCIGDEDVRREIFRLRYKHLLLNDLSPTDGGFVSGMEPSIDAEYYQDWARTQPWWAD